MEINLSQQMEKIGLEARMQFFTWLYIVTFTEAPEHRCILRMTDPALSAILIKFLKALLSDVNSFHLRVPHIIGYLDLLYNQQASEEMQT